MNKGTDLFPWILGGLSVSAVAVAITLVSAGKTPAPALPISTTSMSVPESAPTALPAAAPPAAPQDPAPSPPTAAMLPAAPDPPPAQTLAEQSAPGQIWECMTHGVKTFSNNPCGDKSSLVSVRPINTMNPTPVRSARAYPGEPVYTQPYAEQNSYADPAGESDQDAVYSGNSYAIVPGFAYLPRKRIEHPHRPPHHHNPEHHPGHDPGPPRRN
jgi:hypothetical protein